MILYFSCSQSWLPSTLLPASNLRLGQTIHQGSQAQQQDGQIRSPSWVLGAGVRGRRTGPHINSFDGVPVKPRRQKVLAHESKPGELLADRLLGANLLDLSVL